MPEQSSLLKIALAAGNDGTFKLRVQAACQVHDVPFTDNLVWKVAAAVADSIVLHGDDGHVVDTTGVPDDAITAAVTGSTA